MSSVVVVVPVYKSGLSEEERASLSRCFAMLSNYPIVFVVPEGLDISRITDVFTPYHVEEFSKTYFSNKVTYNALMLSPGFYERFLAWNYMLIYQLDAWIFRDELKEWVAKGYDYVGAPWPVRPIYNNMVYKLCSALKTKLLPVNKTIDGRHVTRGRVGNGGFSLRCNQTIYRLLLRHEAQATYYIERSNYHRYYEDVFFSVEAPKLETGYKIPPFSEALTFAFDTYPKLCYKLNGKRLPFGCHGFNKRKTRTFWSKYILI